MISEVIHIANANMYVLKFGDYPSWRMTYDPLMAEEFPDWQCAAILDTSVKPPSRLAGWNSRLNGWTDESIDGEFAAKCVMALRDLQAKIR
jgi:hypothetical protein